MTSFKWLGVVAVLCLIAHTSLIAQDQDGLTAETRFSDRRVLSHPPVREADILWKRSVTRLIDTREKINLPFRYPARPFFDVLVEGARQGEVPLISAHDPTGKTPLPLPELESSLFSVDTVLIIDPVTNEWRNQEVVNVMNTEDIRYFYIKEVWYFDSRYSTMRCRITGIAPVMEEYREESGRPLTKVLFWVDYSRARAWLARQPAFEAGNDQAALSWEDVFESRRFSSYITKVPNVLDARLQDQYTGADLLLESRRQEEAIHQFEHDLWEW